MVGTGDRSPASYGGYVKAEAQRRKDRNPSILPTAEAIEEIKRQPNKTNAILHLTC